MIEALCMRMVGVEDGKQFAQNDVYHEEYEEVHE